jgi:hypothetical protein
LKGGVFLAAYWWLWFEVDRNGVHAQRRDVVVALLGGTIAAMPPARCSSPCRSSFGRCTRRASVYACRQALRFSATHPPVFYAIAWLLTLEVAVLFADLRCFLLDTAHIARALV